MRDQCKTNRPIRDQCQMDCIMRNQCKTHRPMRDQYQMNCIMRNQYKTNRSMRDQWQMDCIMRDQCKTNERPDKMEILNKHLSVCILARLDNFPRVQLS